VPVPAPGLVLVCTAAVESNGVESRLMPLVLLVPVWVLVLSQVLKLGWVMVLLVPC
jgi:hypothetical protein